MKTNVHVSFFFLTVPAQIIDELSSDDVTVQEGDMVILTCNVTGVPKPEVTWYRRPVNSKISERKRKMCKPRSIGPGKIIFGSRFWLCKQKSQLDDPSRSVYASPCPSKVGQVAPPGCSSPLRMSTGPRDLT